MVAPVQWGDESMGMSKKVEVMGEGRDILEAPVYGTPTVLVWRYL